MSRKHQIVSKIQPLQLDTVHLVKGSYIKGGFEKTIDLVGTTFSTLITVERVSDNTPVFEGTYRFTCSETGKFKVTDMKTGSNIGTEYDASSADAVITDLYGLKITVTSGLTGVVADDICDVYITGDSTYIVPGTVLGRIKDDTSPNVGKYEPIGSDLTKYDVLRICAGAVETNPQNFVPGISNTVNNMDNDTTSVYVFAQLIEEACRSINLTDDAKAMINGIVWE